MMPERQHEPEIGLIGKLALATIVAVGLLAAFGWLVT